MNRLIQPKKRIFTRLRYSKITGVFVIILITLILPTTVYLAQQSTNIEQSAASCNPANYSQCGTGGCTPNHSHWYNVVKTCDKKGHANYKCSDTGTSSKCGGGSSGGGGGGGSGATCSNKTYNQCAHTTGGCVSDSQYAQNDLVQVHRTTTQKTGNCYYSYTCSLAQKNDTKDCGSATAKSHLACSSQHTCHSVSGAGNNSCTNDCECTNPPSCNSNGTGGNGGPPPVCVNGTCSPSSGKSTNTCAECADGNGKCAIGKPSNDPSCGNGSNNMCCLPKNGNVGNGVCDKSSGCIGGTCTPVDNKTCFGNTQACTNSKLCKGQSSNSNTCQVNGVTGRCSNSGQCNSNETLGNNGNPVSDCKVPASQGHPDYCCIPNPGSCAPGAICGPVDTNAPLVNKLPQCFGGGMNLGKKGCQAQDYCCQSKTKASVAVTLANNSATPQVTQVQATATLLPAATGQAFLASRVSGAKVLGIQAYTATDVLTFDAGSGNYVNQNFNLGNLPSGQYQIFLHIDKYLTKQLTQSDGSTVFNLGSGQPLSSGLATMIPGDITPSPHGDNFIDILDFNKVMFCIGKSPTGNCQLADLNNDGTIGQDDVDIVQSHFGAIGDSPSGNGVQFTCIPDPSCQSGSSTIQLCPLKCGVQSTVNSLQGL